MKNVQMTPEEALYFCFFLSCTANKNGSQGKPGEVILKCSSTTRNALKELKSENIKDLRQDYIKSIV